MTWGGGGGIDDHCTQSIDTGLYTKFWLSSISNIEIILQLRFCIAKLLKFLFFLNACLKHRKNVVHNTSESL